MKIGKIIKEIRTEKKINQSELARACGITQPYLSQLENDQKIPSNALITSIGKILNIPSSVLYYLAIEEKDVPDNKKAAYKALSQTIEALVKSVYL